MEYGKIIAVTGIPGLYELLSSKNDGAIVRSLEDKSTKFLSSRIHNFSHLESIEVFTVRDNVNLSEIFHAMEQSGEKIPDAKDAAAIKKYFEKIYPELDFERVYSSDLKKMIKWFSVLKDNQIEIKLTPVEEESPAEEIQEPAAQPAEKTAGPQKAPAKKKAEKGKEDKSDTVDAAAKAPVKKKAEKETKAKAAKPKETETKAPAKKAAPKKKTKE